MKKCFIVLLLFTAISNAMEKKEMPQQEASFTVKYTKVHEENIGKRIDNSKSDDHLISSMVYHFCTLSKYPTNITVVNNKVVANGIGVEQLKKMVSAIKYEQASGTLDFTGLIDVICKPLTKQRDECLLKMVEVQKENDDLRKENDEVRREKNGIASALTRLRVHNNDLGKQLKQQTRWLYQRHPLLTAAGAVLLSLPLYYGLFSLLKTYHS